jgi:hypothetical protein
MLQNRILLFKQNSRNEVIKLFLSVLCLSFLISGCENDTGNIGLVIQPIGDKPGIAGFDTTTVAAFTSTQDSVRADELTYSLLGSCFDPTFGFSQARFLTQVTLSYFPFYPGDTVTIDSVIMSFRVADKYGYLDNTQTVYVKELVNDIYYDSLYYTNMDIQGYVSPDVIGTATFTPSDTLINIRLDNQIGEKLFEDSLSLTNPNKLKEHFKGFYIYTDPVTEKGAILYLNPTHTDTKVSVYYSNTILDSLVYAFEIYSTTARINLYHHDFSQADPSNKILHLNNTSEDSVIYLQGMAGVAGKLTFPYLTHWTDTLKAAVNLVELIVPVEMDDPNKLQFTAPAKLQIFTRTEDGLYHSIPDMLMTSTYFGGNYDLENFLYSFNVTEAYKQYVYREKDDLVFYLLPNNYASTSERIILSSGINSRKIQLKAYYTKL